jgi:hypothetical protein
MALVDGRVCLGGAGLCEVRVKRRDRKFRPSDKIDDKIDDKIGHRPAQGA